METSAVTYTTTTGTYKSWNINVNLDAPSLFENGRNQFNDKMHILNYYNALQYTLFENDYPETIDRSNEARNGQNYGITVAILSSPVECMITLLEGGKQAPGDFLLILSPSWITKEKSISNKDAYTLFVSKAISFHSAGATYIDAYNPPRKVTYFVNFLTAEVTSGQTNEGDEIAMNIETPTSSSYELSGIIDDKMYTRICMAEVEIEYPQCLCLAYEPAIEYAVPEGVGDVTLVVLKNDIDFENMIAEATNAFLHKVTNRKSKATEQNLRIVIKPSGGRFFGSYGVTMHDASDDKSIIKAVLQLFDELKPGEGILLEIFHHAKIRNKEMKDKNLSFRIKTLCTRGPDNVPVSSYSTCAIGDLSKQFNGDVTSPKSLKSTLAQWGLQNDFKRIREAITKAAEKVFAQIIAKENRMSPTSKGGKGAQTDIIDLDFVLGEKDGKVVPFMIEVNSHDCVINHQIFEFINPLFRGTAIAPYVENMIFRSQGYLLNGKTILVIGSGSPSKRFVWTTAMDFGVKVILVDAIEYCDEFAKENVELFIEYDLTDHTKDREHAENILNLIKAQNLHVDGCITIWEDDGPLTAMICELLNKTGASVAGALTAKKKSETLAAIMAQKGDIPHFPRVYLYGSKFEHINSRDDLGRALDIVGMPCMLKPEYGSSAIGTTLIYDKDEATTRYDSITSDFEETEYEGIGLGHGKSMMIMDYLVGTEHDIDVIIFNRKLIAAFVSDNGPTLNTSGRSTETAAAMPSVLPTDEVAQLKTAAYQCCVELGLKNGVFNVEMMMTATGPKLIEVNGRMGGFYLRNWIKRVYGVDLLYNAFLISLGIKPIIIPSRPKCQVMGVMCLPSKHSKILLDKNTQISITKLIEEGVVMYQSFDDIVETTSVTLEEPCCNIAVVAKTLRQSKDILLHLCNSFGLNTEDYPIEYFLKYFAVRK